MNIDERIRCIEQIILGVLYGSTLVMTGFLLLSLRAHSTMGVVMSGIYAVLLGGSAVFLHRLFRSRTPKNVARPS